MANKDLTLSNLLGTLKNTFKVALATLSASGLTAPRTFTLPDKTGTVALVSDITDIADNTYDPTGFVFNPSAFSPISPFIIYNKTNRTITIGGATGSAKFYYYKGVLKSIAQGWTSAAHSASDGNYFLYSTDGDNFSWSTTPGNFGAVMLAAASIKASPAHAFAICETHGCMPWSVHQELHNTIGTWRKSGGELTAATYTENTATDAANTPGFDAAVAVDEDLETDIAAWTQGTYTTVYIGSSRNATFNTAATLPFTASGSYLQINDPVAGTLAAGINNRYYNVYQILIPTASDTDSQLYRMVMLQPQAAHASLALAQAENPAALNFGDFSTLATEWCIYARITYVTSVGDSNTGKCRIATGGVSYVSHTRVGSTFVGGSTDPRINAAEQSVASASTCDIYSATSENILITGTTTITSFSNTAPVGTKVFIRFQSAISVTLSASIIYDGALTSKSFAAGDSAMLLCTASGTWVITAVKSGKYTYYTPVAMNGLTSTVWTLLDPDNICGITVLFDSVSTSGTAVILVQIGTSTIATTGYLGSSGTGSSSSTSTAGFSIKVASAAAVIHGQMRITKWQKSATDYQWIEDGIFGQSDTGVNVYCAGNKTLTGAIQKIQVNRSSADSFDGGNIQIITEAW